jgi:hypothetical protein
VQKQDLTLRRSLPQSQKNFTYRINVRMNNRLLQNRTKQAEMAGKAPGTLLQREVN